MKTGIVLGGCGHGKLTQAAIIKYRAYYGKAVRAHPNNLDAMRDGVWDTLKTSTTPSQQMTSHSIKRCNGFYQKATFYRHKLNCSRGIDDTDSMDKGSISTTVLAVVYSQDQDSFAEYILGKFANDDLGNFCRTDV